LVPILAGDGQGLGVFRVSGSARVGGESRAWSVILKVLPGTPGSPTGWNYPVREALAYERGLLDDLPPGLGAPRCFGHAEHGGQHFLWLEDLGSDAIRWRLDDYGKAARALGRFNGAYLIGRSLPVAGWLSQQWLRSWWRRVPARCASFLASDGTRSYSACIRARSSIAYCSSGRVVMSSSTGLIECPKYSAITMRSVGISS
jgi:hypothetical protein